MSKSAPTHSLDDIVGRLARAEQDARIIFSTPVVTTLPNGATQSTATILHEGGPAAKREERAARAAVQVEANRLADEGLLEDAWTLLVSAADATHARFPQYRGHWDGFVLARLARDCRAKSGVLLAGDVVLLDPTDRSDAGFSTVHCVITSINVSVKSANVRACS